MDYTQLKQLLSTQGITDITSSAEAAAQLNSPTVTIYRALTGDDLMIWAAGNGADYLAIEQAAASGNHLARMAMKLLDDSQRSLNITRADVQAWISGLVQTGVLSQTGADAFFAIGAVQVSPAQAAGLGSPTEGDINFARNN